MGLGPIRDIAHRLEDIFKALFNEEVEIDGTMETWMLEAFDCLREPLEQQMQMGSFDGEQALTKALTIIEKIEARLGSALTEADDYIPSSEDLGIDIVSSIFDVDVVESLEKIQQLIDDKPDSFADELLAQMEVFGGFAELLNLPGFGEITATVIKAIETNPQQLEGIASVALANLTAAHGQVMAGDRDRGGEPSAELIALTQPHQALSPGDLFEDQDNLVDQDGFDLALDFPMAEDFQQGDLDQTLASIEAMAASSDLFSDVDTAIEHGAADAEDETMIEYGADIFGNDLFSNNDQLNDQLLNDQLNLESFAEADTVIELPNNGWAGDRDNQNDLVGEDLFGEVNTGLDFAPDGPEDLGDLFQDSLPIPTGNQADLDPGINELGIDDLAIDADLLFGGEAPHLDQDLTAELGPIDFEQDFDLESLANDGMALEQGSSFDGETAADAMATLDFDLESGDLDGNIFGDADLESIDLGEELPALSLDDGESIDDMMASSEPEPANPPRQRGEEREIDLTDDVRTDEAYQFFIEEVPELLHTMEEGLLKLRNERTSALVHEIMRAAHSIKGGAASVGLNSIKEIAHRLEDIFKALFNENIAIDRRLDRLLLDSYDRLKNPLMDQLQRGHFDGQRAYGDALKVIQEIEEILGDDLYAADDYLPSSEDLGVDIVSSIFEVDVAEGIAQIEAMASNPADYDLAPELAGQMEVFSGLAEILNLPGFGEIVATVTQAIAANPDQLPIIADLAFKDFSAASKLVLEQGDRESGGSPSPGLVALTTTVIQASPSAKSETPEPPEPSNLDQLFFPTEGEPWAPELDFGVIADEAEATGEELSIDFDAITGGMDGEAGQELFSVNAPETDESQEQDILRSWPMICLGPPRRSYPSIKPLTKFNPTKLIGRI
ncbi:MAG: hypothetical protein HC796_01325 [Synechococcaceae cyanobacterium RL_1_2]|nr:hypothetical protein [Synechococcaceae cyanobacterium RL_1_2]